jgi:hypothetical protein
MCFLISDANIGIFEPKFQIFNVKLMLKDWGLDIMTY